jgi:hypothetical protein
MKYSASYPAVAGLALATMLLPATALAEKKTSFTSKETDTEQNFAWFPGIDGNWYVFDGSAKFTMESLDEPRVAGHGEYSMYAVLEMSTGAITLWGKFHSENADGGWDGFYTGTGAGFTATCVGSGEYAGLVSRWVWTPTTDGNGIYNWKGYIVENGPGEVPFKISGWRAEEVVPITPGMVKAVLTAGGGKASHIGVFQDVKETGLMMFTSPTTGVSRGMGIAEAANGDLFTWVSFGAMKSAEEFEFQVFFAGGTGRFEHAVGSYTGQVNWKTVPPSYKGAGTIRY